MAGVPDVSPRATWQELVRDEKAMLVDCRTDAEWNFVGIPDLSETGKDVVLIPWQVYPSMQVNGAFAEHLHRAGATPETKLYFICRSGARSLAAGHAAQAAGFPNAFNVADGFEGPVDSDGHRGTVGGLEGGRSALAATLGIRSGIGGETAPHGRAFSMRPRRHPPCASKFNRKPGRLSGQRFGASVGLVVRGVVQPVDARDHEGPAEVARRARGIGAMRPNGAAMRPERAVAAEQAGLRRQPAAFLASSWWKKSRAMA
jgi:rhodanese-related sulfurtransferase